MTPTDEPLFEDEFGEEPEPTRGSNDASDLEDRIRRLVTSQPYAVLCTQAREQPYGALVAFAFSENLSQAVLATPIATRKYRILSECDRVALLVDNRPDHPDDLMSVEGLTATGRAILLDDEAAAAPWGRLLVERHAYLKEFVAAPSSALFRIDIVRFFHVTRFQEVRQWRP